MLTAEQRRARDMLKAQIKELERPGKLASAKTRRDARKARAIGQVTHHSLRKALGRVA